MNPNNPEAKAKHRVCTNCTNIRTAASFMCPRTRFMSDWTVDEYGNRSRTVSGGVCGRTIENYGRPVGDAA
jgi:hypothetical protein